MSQRSAFVNNYLDDLIRRDLDIQDHFTDTSGNLLDADHSLFKQRRSLLKQSLGNSYDAVFDAKGVSYGKRSFTQTYVATPLRWLGAGLYGAGSALFWSLPGPVGFTFTLGGAAASTLADIIDSYSYIKSGQLKGKRLGSIWAEGLLEKVLGYLPIGTGAIDFYRGRKKFESKITTDMAPAVQDALHDAKYDFLTEMRKGKKEGNIIPLSRFKDPRYAPSLTDQVSKAA